MEAEAAAKTKMRIDCSTLANVRTNCVSGVTSVSGRKQGRSHEVS